MDAVPAGASSSRPAPASNVRRAAIGDAAALVELTVQLGYPSDPDAITARLDDLLVRDDHQVLVTCDGDGRAVGWIHVAERRLLESPPHAEILGLVVHRDYRRQHRGERLVSAAEAWAAGRALAFVSVRSNVTRAESHPFYERLGYVRAKTQHAYRKQISREP
ncbi:MAG TPA: GNAT family N-acetyltransferase [Vicinamibacterales bacterium]|nr:GNAT family N-acetyltransferase [Vicinamibacterales bacterium]